MSLSVYPEEARAPVAEHSLLEEALEFGWLAGTVAAAAGRNVPGVDPSLHAFGRQSVAVLSSQHA
jgi:hypothetical protein